MAGRCGEFNQNAGVEKPKEIKTHPVRQSAILVVYGTLQSADCSDDGILLRQQISYPLPRVCRLAHAHMSRNRTDFGAKITFHLLLPSQSQFEDDLRFVLQKYH